MRLKQVSGMSETKHVGYYGLSLFHWETGNSMYLYQKKAYKSISFKKFHISTTQCNC